MNHRQSSHQRSDAVRTGRGRLRTSAVLVVVAATVVAPLGGAAASATTPGDNGRIVYAAQLDTGSQLFTIGADGTGVRQITNTPGTDNGNPDWSPDGSHIVYGSGNESGAFIDVARSDGSHAHAVRPNGLDGFLDQPAFVPHTRDVVFERIDPTFTNDGVWIMRRDGSHPRQITRNPFTATAGGFDTDPNLSPDGRTLTFVRGSVPDDRQALYSVHVDGSQLRQLTPYRYDVAIKHDWAPDGKRIVITVNANVGSHPTLSANIATIRPNGSGFRLLTHFHGRMTNAFAGSYSPDGRWIVYRVETGDGTGTLDGGRFGLYKIHPWGGKPVLIAALVSRPRFIDWGTAP